MPKQSPAGMSLAAVDAFAAKLPNAAAGTKWDQHTWMVNDHAFCWERPLRKSDLARYGDATPPSGEIVAIAVENLDAKDALLAMGLPGFFTIPHFNGYPAVLVELRLASPADVRAAIEAGWRSASAKPPRRKRAPRPRARRPAKPGVAKRSAATRRAATRRGAAKKAR